MLPALVVLALLFPATGADPGSRSHFTLRVMVKWDAAADSLMGRDGVNFIRLLASGVQTILSPLRIRIQVVKNGESRMLLSVKTPD